MATDRDANVRSDAVAAPVGRRIDGALGGPLDDVDRTILRALLGDVRMAYAELAERCHVSRSTAHARVDQLRRRGVITGFTVTVDAAALGFGVSALIFIKIRQHDWRRARDAIMEVTGVESLQLCAGGYDLVAHVRCHDMTEFRDSLLVELHAIDDVVGTETVFVLDEVRRPLQF